MMYEEVLGSVEEFCNQASEGKAETQSITVNQVTGTLVYVRNGAENYQEVLSKMFGVINAYEEWDSDFVLFRVNDRILAAGTYTLGSAAEEENEVKEFTNVLITEVDNLRIDNQIIA